MLWLQLTRSEFIEGLEANTDAQLKDWVATALAMRSAGVTRPAM
jgi:hypothetical protein